MIHWALAIGLLIVGYLVLVIVINRFVQGPQTITVKPPAGPLETSPAEISLLTWNLGYAGLGAESDFIVDGGTHYFPPSKAIVRKNLDGIKGFLRTAKADVLLLQELAGPSLVTRRIDVMRGVQALFPSKICSFRADLQTRLIPAPFKLHHGTGIISSFEVVQHTSLPLPYEDGYYAGIFRRSYGAHLIELPTTDPSISWSIMNIHLAAFDDAAAARRNQLAALIDHAVAEYDAGKFVVVGGDWNLMLTETHFPHTSKDEDLFWLHPFPGELLPEGWRIVSDPDTATVRTNERPYKKGENYTAIIDGYLVSPNVEVVEVDGIDHDFQWSDHNPVFARFRARGFDGSSSTSPEN